ncbi:DUF6266 family protein [Arcticibacter tournemirensis]|uniref:Uncharacterized protein n=1 Tax=Arcticibacter tournemirensis TaxID=699437 RepID=A0A4Q0M9C5_9SPHI|nr:DUF6266 family protein [Arcticibacter tournemirensis]RXF69369.1 hypothetical protein EKH83_11835 [Arcticibacter tournemirensis]
MATIYNGIISGKIGDKIYYSFGGKNYVRKAPERKAPPTEKQLRTRAKLVATSDFLTSLRPLVDEVWERRRYIKNTAFGSAFSYMMRNAVDSLPEGPSIRYRDILLSRGSVYLPQELSLLREACDVKVSWENRYMRNTFYCRDEDEVIVVLHFPSDNANIIYRGEGVRRDEVMSVAIPEVFAHDCFHAYFLFASADGQRSSDSVYLGAF